MSLAYHCERTDCDSWQQTAETETGWVAVHFIGTISEHHFCSMPCLTEWAINRNQGLELIEPGADA